MNLGHSLTTRPFNRMMNGGIRLTSMERMKRALFMINMCVRCVDRQSYAMAQFTTGIDLHSPRESEKPETSTCLPVYSRILQCLPTTGESAWLSSSVRGVRSLWSCDIALITVRAISGVIDNGFITVFVDLGGSLMSSSNLTNLSEDATSFHTRVPSARCVGGLIKAGFLSPAFFSSSLLFDLTNAFKSSICCCIAEILCLSSDDECFAFLFANCHS